MSDVVSVSEIPGTGHDLEDYVAALFQASGYFVEKGLTERDPDDVLELDIVASKYTKTAVRRILAEVKGGGWGYPDVFKVVGWLRYLGLTEGGFFVKKPDGHLSEMQNRVAKLGVTLVEFGDFTQAAQTFEGEGLGTPQAAEVVELWRFAYEVERKLVETIVRRSKSEKDKAGPQEARRYHRLINDGTFFAQSPEESLKLLYDAYMEHPRFTAANASEIDGNDYNPVVGSAASPSFADALRDGSYPYLQACMFLEHRARLAILKAAVDYVVANPEAPGAGDSWNSSLIGLPASFQHAIEWLRRQATYWQYATFWQQFLWGWGGFLVEEKIEDEYAWMATCSGIPAVEIPVALEAFDKFFPISGGWFRTVGRSSLRQVMMMPWMYKGLGAHFRREQYGEKNFTQIAPSGYSAKDLVSWNNYAVAFLSK